VPENAKPECRGGTAYRRVESSRAHVPFDDEGLFKVFFVGGQSVIQMEL
jgi:hypothetical protein